VLNVLNVLNVFNVWGKGSRCARCTKGIKGIKKIMRGWMIPFAADRSALSALALIRLRYEREAGAARECGREQS